VNWVCQLALLPDGDEMRDKVHVASMRRAEYNELCREFPGYTHVLDSRVQFMGPKAVVLITSELREQVSDELLDRLFWVANRISEEKFLSYFLQVSEILKLPKSQANSVLEIGPGRGIFRSMITNYGYHVTTLDINPVSAPDSVGDVLNLPFQEGAFDMVVCFQVLEHLQYRYFKHAVEEMAFVAKNYVYLSLPYQCNAISLELRLRVVQKYLHRLSGAFTFFLPVRAVLKDVDEQALLQREDKHNPHYWEIGRRSFPERRILSDIEAVHLKVMKKFHSRRKPYHFFVLCKTA
jgi:hypothetical protein